MSRHHELACVLLSGGVDSTAALHWAIGRFRETRAIAFDYGQPHRDAELYAAQCLAEARDIPFDRVVMAGTLATGNGFMRVVSDHDASHQGVNAAFLPGRNAVFCTVAAAHACSWWPIGNIAIVVGATADDSVGFPDCRFNFFAALSVAIRCGYAREIGIDAPFAGLRKADVLRDLDEDGRRDVARSWSCYRGKGPCGTCTACVVRRAAFDAAGIVDESAEPMMHGGDPARGCS